MRRLQLAQPLLVLDARRAIHVGAALEHAEHQRDPRPGIELRVVKIGIAGVQQPSVLVAHRDPAMAERVARQRDHQNVRLAVAERAHALEAEPVLAAGAVERPIRPVLPLRRDVASFRRHDLMRHRHVEFLAMDMYLGLWKVRHAARMVAIEMRQQQMPYVIGREAERLHLADGRLGRIKPRRGLPDPFAPEPRRVADVVEPDAGVDQHEAVIALDQQAVTDHPRPLEDAAAAVHEPLADRAHGAGVEMVDAHDQSSAEFSADLPPAFP